MRIGSFSQPCTKKYKSSYNSPKYCTKKSFYSYDCPTNLILLSILLVASYSHIYLEDSANKFNDRAPTIKNSNFSSIRRSLQEKNPHLHILISRTHGILKNDSNFYAKCTNGNRRQHGISIAHFNKGPAFLHNKIHEVENIVQDRHPHILGVSEANFLASHDLEDVQIQDYELYTCPTLTNPDIQASRIVIFKHNSLIGKLRPDLMNDNFSSIWLEIGYPRQKKFLVCQFYRDWQFLNQSDKSSKTPAAQLERWIIFLDQWERALASGMECHVLGDCNIDAQCFNRPDIANTPHNTRLRPLVEKLFERIFPHGVSQLVTSVTRQDTILDHYYCNNPSKLSPVQTENRGGSDHKLIVATRYAKKIQKQQRYVTKRCYKNFDSEEFKAAVKMLSWWELYQCEDLNQAVLIFSRRTSKLLDKMAPVKKIQVRVRFTTWLSDETKKLMKERDYAQLRASQSNKTDDIHEFKNLRNRVTNRLKKEKKNWKQGKLQECGNNSGQIWKNVLGWLNWKSSGAPTQIFHNGRLENKPARIATCINEYFVSKVDTIIRNLPQSQADPLKTLLLRENRAPTFSLKPAYPDQIGKIISGLKNSNTSGVDFIDTGIIKLVSEDILPAVTHLVNLSIKQSEFPLAWKHAKVIPLHKKEDILDPKNYRPVAILPILSKILERVIFQQVVAHFDENQLFHPNHHGFRQHHNTCTALVQMYDGWVEAAERGELTGVCMLDMSAAFDVVNHNLLLQKLRLYGFDQKSLAWMTSYLSGRTQSVCIDGTLSDPLELTAGVPQGSILGPLCYIIFTNDLPETIFTCQEHQASHQQFNTHCNECGSVCCFADDSTLSISDKSAEVVTEKLTEKYAVLSEYLISNRLKLNDDKTHLILMTTSQNRKLKNPQIQVNTPNETIRTTDSEKLLGGFIHRDLKWADHIVDNEKSLIKSLTTRLNALKKICRYSNFKTRLMIANGVFISKLIYLIPLWGGACRYLLKMLQVIQNKAARYVTRSSWSTSTRDLLRQCNWLSVTQLSAYHSLVMTHKTMLSQQPKYLHDKFGSQYPCNTRLAASSKIRIDASFNAELSLAHSSFRWRASKLYNELPLEIRSETKMIRFKATLKKWVQVNIEI